MRGIDLVIDVTSMRRRAITAAIGFIVSSKTKALFF